MRVRVREKAPPPHPTTTPPYPTPPHHTYLPHHLPTPPHPDRWSIVPPPPPCPSPPPYYCDLTSHGQHRTPPLTYPVLGRDVSARLEQHLQACVIALQCREVQGGVVVLGEEWGWRWGESERGEREWWSWTVGDQRICDNQRIVCQRIEWDQRIIWGQRMYD